MKKPVTMIICLALFSCATEPLPTATPKLDPCQSIQWIDGNELNCGPGKVFCIAEVKISEDNRCRLWCDFRSYPSDWVEADASHSYIKIRYEYSAEVQLCLVRQK